MGTTRVCRQCGEACSNGYISGVCGPCCALLYYPPAHRAEQAGRLLAHAERVAREEPLEPRHCSGCGMVQPEGTIFRGHGTRAYLCDDCWDLLREKFRMGQLHRHASKAKPPRGK